MSQRKIKVFDLIMIIIGAIGLGGAAWAVVWLHNQQRTDAQRQADTQREVTK
jgi:hypothetical protein